MSRWREEPTSPIDVHVVPEGDQIGHDCDDSCPCGPDVRIGPRSNGVDGWVHKHRSLDGREYAQSDHEGEPQ